MVTTKVTEEADALIELRIRIVERMKLVMRQRGYPVALPDAARMLAGRLGWDVSATLHLLSGVVTPSLPQLVQIAAELEVPIEHLVAMGHDLPAHTVTVPSVGGFEPLAIRLPRAETLNFDDAGGLVYHQMVRSPGFGVEGGDVVITTRRMPAAGPVQNCLYLFYDDESGVYSLRLCTDANRKGVFRSMDDHEPTFMWRGRESCEEFVCGEMVAILRTGALLHRNGEALWKAAQLQKAERPAT